MQVTYTEPLTPATSRPSARLLVQFDPVRVRVIVAPYAEDADRLAPLCVALEKALREVEGAC